MESPYLMARSGIHSALHIMHSIQVSVQEVAILLHKINLAFRVLLTKLQCEDKANLRNRAVSSSTVQRYIQSGLRFVNKLKPSVEETVTYISDVYEVTNYEVSGDKLKKENIVRAIIRKLKTENYRHHDSAHVSCMQERNTEMEDANCVSVGFPQESFIATEHSKEYVLLKKKSECSSVLQIEQMEIWADMEMLVSNALDIIQHSHALIKEATNAMQQSLQLLFPEMQAKDLNKLPKRVLPSAELYEKGIYKLARVRFLSGTTEMFVDFLQRNFKSFQQIKNNKGKPKTEKHNEHGTGNGLSYGLGNMQGWRTNMEDAHCALIGLPQGLKDWSYFAVFDGHSGSRVSMHCAKNLLDTIIQSEDFCNKTDGILCNSHVFIEDVERIKNCIKDGFLSLDEKMRKIPEIASFKDRSGSTAVCCLISSKHFYFANCGDSRAVLSRNKMAYFVTEDHKPYKPVEKERIETALGTVRNRRVNGSLAVSRALGNYIYKWNKTKTPCEQMVSPEPQVDVIERDNELDEFLVFACDGIWDVMTNEEICDFIRYMMHVTHDLEYICNCVIDACFCKGSKDNMSIILVALPGAPNLTEEAIQQDNKMKKILENKIKEFVSSTENIEVKEIMRMLADDESIRILGNVFFKLSFVEEVYNKLRSNLSDKEELVQDITIIQ